MSSHYSFRKGNGTPLQYSYLENLMDGGAWEAAVHGVAKSQTRLSDFTFTFHFQALEKEMATHSSVLAWRIPEMGEPGGLPSMGSHRVVHDWSDLAAAAADAISIHYHPTSGDNQKCLQKLPKVPGRKMGPPLPSSASLRTTDGKQWFSKDEPQTPEGPQDLFRVRSIWGTSLWVRIRLEIQGTQVPYLIGKLKIRHGTEQLNPHTTESMHCNHWRLPTLECERDNDRYRMRKWRSSLLQQRPNAAK